MTDVDDIFSRLATLDAEAKALIVRADRVKEMIPILAAAIARMQELGAAPDLVASLLTHAAGELRGAQWSAEPPDEP